MMALSQHRPCAGVVSSSGLLQGGKDGWYKMIGPDASKFPRCLLLQTGWRISPELKNITVLDRK